MTFFTNRIEFRCLIVPNLQSRWCHYFWKWVLDYDTRLYCNNVFGCFDWFICHEIFYYIYFETMILSFRPRGYVVCNFKQVNEFEVIFRYDSWTSPVVCSLFLKVEFYFFLCRGRVCGFGWWYAKNFPYILPGTLLGKVFLKFRYNYWKILLKFKVLP